MNSPDTDKDRVIRTDYDLKWNIPIKKVSPSGATIYITLDEKGRTIRKEITGVKDIDNKEISITEYYEYNAH